MASKETWNKREYYCNTFNPALHPIIYQCLRELQLQAEMFQITVDPIYDRFLRDVNCEISFNGVKNKDDKKVNEDSLKKYVKQKM